MCQQPCVSMIVATSSHIDGNLLSLQWHFSGLFLIDNILGTLLVYAKQKPGNLLYSILLKILLRIHMVFRDYLILLGSVLCLSFCLLVAAVWSTAND